MCTHNNLTFLGYQECPDGSAIPLYNCMECRTTIALYSSKKKPGRNTVTLNEAAMVRHASCTV